MSEEQPKKSQHTVLRMALVDKQFKFIKKQMVYEPKATDQDAKEGPGTNMSVGDFLKKLEDLNK